MTTTMKTDVYGIENRLFSISFKVIKLSGFWRPTTFRKPFDYIYEMYTLFCLVSILMLIATIVVDNVVTEKSIRSLIENLYLILTVSNGISKLSNIYLRRDRVISMLRRNSEDRWSVHRDDEEARIVEESIESESYIIRFCIYLVTINNVSNALNPILNPDPEHDLMVDAYSPCDRSKSDLCFWTAYLYQVFGYVSTSLVHVGCDCLVFNFVDRLCAHLKILEHRILQLPDLVEANACDEIRYLKSCVEDHHSICEGIKELNDTFYETIFIQFVTSISVLCTNIYLLSMQDLFSAEFIAVFVYLCCAFVQNFFYCWYGYKVSVNTLRISDAIFNMNWCILKRDSKKILSYVMMKTSQKVFLFNSAVVTLTPESFVNILKVSYSAFNILQQTK
ncbi:hypothetical protein TSAR_004362 [Trichomalopsis sarcophagae]|uniref:Odorant receptor n=1 Tax=Trichomalopsis sarcophagae TaxID=543379 RepID=A0A232EQE9_9HYME|nr:hypothetical protein TSAR_004362 [Trichomalopsis sarcophagae]